MRNVENLHLELDGMPLEDVIHSVFGGLEDNRAKLEEMAEFMEAEIIGQNMKLNRIEEQLSLLLDAIKSVAAQAVGCADHREAHQSTPATSPDALRPQPQPVHER